VNVLFDHEVFAGRLEVLPDRHDVHSRAPQVSEEGMDLILPLAEPEARARKVPIEVPRES